MTTQTGARQDIKVALAIVVLTIDRCQKTRSPEKNRPDNNTAGANVSFSREFLSRSSHHAHTNNTGSPSNTRQNALANGPTSENRTNTGDTPMAMAPMVKAAKAIGTERGGIERIADFLVEVMGESLFIRVSKN